MVTLVLSQELNTYLMFSSQGPNPEEKPPTGSGDSVSVSEAKATGQTSSNSGVATDKNRNYVVLAGVVAGMGSLGWYLQSKKKPEEVQA